MSREKSVEALLVISMGLLILSQIFHRQELLYASVAVGSIGIFIPWLTIWVAKGWYLLAEGLGFVSSKILLSTVFYVFLFPVAVLSRLFASRAFLAGKEDVSCYTNRDHVFQPGDFERMW